MSLTTDTLAEIARRFPGQPIAHGIDAKGPWARIGDTTARGRPGVDAALRAALAKAERA